jgi:hypothetical protein
MQRLTEWTGERWIASLNKIYGHYIGDQSCFERLAEYEDLGVTPDQIKDMDNLYYEKCREVSELQRKLKQDRWIPVSEMLPPEDKIMLVSCKTKKGLKSVNRAYYSAGCWHGSGSMSGVVAWTQLPDPYRPEEESL